MIYSITDLIEQDNDFQVTAYQENLKANTISVTATLKPLTRNITN